MNAPAVLRRRAGMRGDEAVTVAKGPFIILVHSLLAIAPDQRDDFWISMPMGDIGAAQAESTLERWMRPMAAAA